MESRIDQIRRLLDEIEKEAGADNKNEVMASFTLLDLPEIVVTIVDFLQPLLLPYEAAIYWHMLTNSIVKVGKDQIRVSVRGLGKPKTVIKSSSGQSEGLSYGAVKEALDGLESKHVIQKVGDTNREGTLYRVYLPEEIEMCKAFMKDKSATQPLAIDEKKETDFYNIRENRYKIFERDAYKCHYCSKQLTRYSATLDHIQPISKGGDNSYDNLITACLHCNSNRSNRDVMDAILRAEKSTQTT